MSTLRLSRRGLFGGFAALLAAPAIVRVASIMPVVPVAERLTLRGIPLEYDTLEDLMNRRFMAIRQDFYKHLKDWLDEEIYRQGSGDAPGGLAEFLRA